MIALSIVIAGALVAGALIYGGESSVDGDADIVIDVETGALPVPAPQERDQIIGSLDAPVVIIEYSDFECFYCGRAHPNFKRLVDEYNGDVAWVYRHFPLTNIHPNATEAAEAALCVAELEGNDAFWAYGDALFAAQRNLNPSTYKALANDLGVDEEAFESCFASGKYTERVLSDMDEALRGGGQGTPYSVLVSEKGFVRVSGALPYEYFVAAIEELL